MSDEAWLFLSFVPLILLWFAAMTRRTPTADESRCAFCGVPLSLCDCDCWQSERGERTGSYRGDILDYEDER